MTERWSGAEPEFVKRAAFALMASLAWKDKQAPDDRIQAFLPLIEREADDGRPMVRKAVNWALRQVGKRNAAMNELAIAAARHILASGVSGGKWVANDALRELESAKVRERVGLA